jgi:beta-galactosidase
MHMESRAAAIGALLASLAAGGLRAQAPVYAPAPGGGRASYDLDRGWLFLQEDPREPPALAAYPADAWTRVDLPHGWSPEGAAPGRAGRRDVGWYRRDMTVGDTAGAGYLLHFEGANLVTDVFVNGGRAGGHQGGGIGFDVELTPLLRPGGPNRLDVRVDDGPAPQLIPSPAAHFDLAGGITRDVVLNVVPATRLTALRIMTPDVTAPSGRAVLAVELVASGAPADYAVEAALVAPGGAIVARRTQAAPTPGGARTVTIEMPPVKAPKLWSTASPALYTARVRLLADGKRVDEMSDRFGFRWYELRAGGAFLLNGEPLTIRGTRWREDLPGPGAAGDSARRQALAGIKAAGNNFVSLAHHPHSPAVYRAADELGLLLWDALPWCRGGVGDDGWQANTRRLLEEQIQQNFNHPSIIAWSLGDEVDRQPDRPGGDDAARLNAFIRTLSNLAHALDPGRLTAFRGYAGAAGIVDVVEETLGSGWRGDAVERPETAGDPQSSNSASGQRKPGTTSSPSSSSSSSRSTRTSAAER